LVSAGFWFLLTVPSDLRSAVALPAVPEPGVARLQPLSPAGPATPVPSAATAVVEAAGPPAPVAVSPPTKAWELLPATEPAEGPTFSVAAALPVPSISDLPELRGDPTAALSPEPSAIEPDGLRAVEGASRLPENLAGSRIGSSDAIAVGWMGRKSRGSSRVSNRRSGLKPAVVTSLSVRAASADTTSLAPRIIRVSVKRQAYTAGSTGTRTRLRAPVSTGQASKSFTLPEALRPSGS
jgi:hypothetical protein